MVDTFTFQPLLRPYPEPELPLGLGVSDSRRAVCSIWPRHVNTFWKPVLWFVKGEYQGSWIGDVLRSDTNDNDKRFHEWGQSESGMADIVERFTRAGDLVLDPFLGGGTTGVVASRLGRNFIGADIDPEAIRSSAGRLQLN